MTETVHRIRLQPWEQGSFGERVALTMGSTILWPLSHDDRLTVLITLLSQEILAVAENEHAVDAIIDALRVKLKIELATESPPIQAE
jgi:hypothetical protein